MDKQTIIGYNEKHLPKSEPLHLQSVKPYSGTQRNNTEDISYYGSCNFGFDFSADCFCSCFKREILHPLAATHDFHCWFICRLLSWLQLVL